LPLLQDWPAHLPDETDLTPFVEAVQARQWWRTMANALSLALERGERGSGVQRFRDAGPIAPEALVQLTRSAAEPPRVAIGECRVRGDQQDPVAQGFPIVGHDRRMARIAGFPTIALMGRVAPSRCRRFAEIAGNSGISRWSGGAPIPAMQRIGE
jgi:hypothetical protein